MTCVQETQKTINIQVRKRNPNPNFLVRISSDGVGVFHVKGWGPKSSVCPSKPWKTKLFGGISRNFRTDISGGARKVLEKKVCVQFCPLNMNNSSGLSREWVGVTIVYVWPSSWGKRKHMNKIRSKCQENPGTVPGQSRLCVSLLLDFFRP